MRVFKTHAFAKIADHEDIPDGDLKKAIERAESGLIEAELGSNLIKLRIARKGQGKSSGYRTLIAYKKNTIAVFLYGFAKNERENISKKELVALKAMASVWGNVEEKEIANELSKGTLKEVSYEKKSSRLTETIIETANDMLESGLISEKKHRKITMHLLKSEKRTTTAPLSSEEIKAIREEAHLSQAAFACYLNLTSGQISKLERGERRPKGPLLVILNIMKTKGSDFIHFFEETQEQLALH